MTIYNMYILYIAMYRLTSVSVINGKSFINIPRCSWCCMDTGFTESDTRKKTICFLKFETLQALWMVVKCHEPFILFFKEPFSQEQISQLTEVSSACSCVSLFDCPSWNKSSWSLVAGAFGHAANCCMWEGRRHGSGIEVRPLANVNSAYVALPVVRGCHTEVPSELHFTAALSNDM